MGPGTLVACAAARAYVYDARVVNWPKIENVMSSPESQLTPDHKMQVVDAAGALRPTGPESKQVANAKTPSQAESLLAAEKRALAMMANGARRAREGPDYAFY
jgi:hypothetical protein